MSGTPEHIKIHRELEFLRAAGSVPKKVGKKRTKAKKRIKDRYKKLREVNWND